MEFSASHNTCEFQRNFQLILTSRATFSLGKVSNTSNNNTVIIIGVIVGAAALIIASLSIAFAMRQRAKKNEALARAFDSSPQRSTSDQECVTNRFHRIEQYSSRKYYDGSTTKSEGNS